jgi:hypothetical protein
VGRASKKSFGAERCKNTTTLVTHNEGRKYV